MQLMFKNRERGKNVRIYYGGIETSFSWGKIIRIKTKQRLKVIGVAKYFMVWRYPVTYFCGRSNVRTYTTLNFMYICGREL